MALAMTKVTAIDQIPTNPRARRAWVIFKLHSAGSSFAEIAKREGVARQAIGMALTSPNSHLEEAIAKAIGLTARQLFPERFDASGRRLFNTRPPMRERSKAAVG
jgi:lambda repressor-like predicted transcriptional regulator